MGRENYHSLLYYIGKNRKGFCMGNSSSGIKEAIFFNCPTLNIGNRQKSRLKPNNVINVKADMKQIISKVKKKFNNKKINKNPYKLSSGFEKIPKKVLIKFMKKDFKLKKCTF